LAYRERDSVCIVSTVAYCSPDQRMILIGKFQICSASFGRCMFNPKVNPEARRPLTSFEED
jgi:hypothetical protein